MKARCGVHIEFDHAAAVEKLLSVIKSGEEDYAVSDLVLATGLPTRQIEEVIPQVVNDIHGHLRVTESGDILYYFPQLKNTTGKKSANHSHFPTPSRNHSLKDLGLVFPNLLRAGILGIVGAYALVFLFLLCPPIPIFILSLFGRTEGERHLYFSGSFYSPYMLLDINVVYPWPYYQMPWLTSEISQERKKKTIKSAWINVLGSLRCERSRETNMRSDILAFIIKQKGVLTLEELLTLSGKPLEQTHELLLHLLIDYEGEPGVTDEGNIVYFFPALMKTRREGYRTHDAKTVSKMDTAGNSVLDDGSSVFVVAFRYTLQQLLCGRVIPRRRALDVWV